MSTQCWLIKKNIFISYVLIFDPIYPTRPLEQDMTIFKGTSAMWNAISLVQELNSYRRVHILWR